MFRTVSVIRLSSSVAVLLTVVLFALSGCRILSPKSSAPTPTPIPPIVLGTPASPTYLPPPVQEEPEQYSAFRPIMPGEFPPPMPAWTVQQPVIHDAPPEIEAEPDATAQTAIDELNRRITELETQLEEALQTPPPSVTLEELFQETEPEVRVPKTLPIINKPDVRVYADEWENVRIEIMDKVLFMPNVWRLSAEGEETLRSIAAEIKAYNPDALIDIEGHTDSLMSDPNNPTQKHEISNAKTRAAMDFFVSALRWDAARISTSSFGRNRPVAENGTPEGRARNNRVEIVVRSEGG